MATVINNPPGESSGGGGGGLVVGIVAAIVVILLLMFVVLPEFRDGNGTSTGDTNIEVPEQVDVNVENQ